MKFGSFEIMPFVEQKFWLDGGAMFSVIPKIIWGRLLPSDKNNLIPMQTNLFLLKANGKNILLDTGLGDVISKKEQKIYAATGETNIENGLKKFGVSPDDIDYVFLSHLHTDHSGGTVINTENGLKPRFPKAKYEDVTGLCKLAAPDEVKEQDYSLNPGRYVGVVIEEDGKTEEEFVGEIMSLNDELNSLHKKANQVF